MPLPTCPEDCSANLPEVSFSDCSPELNGGNITYLYLTNFGNGMTNWLDIAEWTARIDNDSVDSAAIRRIRIIGSKPAPDKPEVVISGDRTVYGTPTHTLDFRIDETNAINHEFVRQMECGGQFTGWYETVGGLRWGGNDGIPMTVKVDEIIPESSSEYITFTGQAKWKEKFTPERTEVALIS
jgi:hypothetical protein